MAKNRKRTPPKTKSFAEGGALPLTEDLDSDQDVEVDIPEDPLAEAGDVEEMSDGSAEVTLEDEVRTMEDTEFDENLADVLAPEIIGRLGREYVDLAEQDIQARQQRDKQYAEGIKKSGLTGTDNQSGGADFEGASRVAHPMLSKASIEFESRAIKELFPANGPAKTQIIGEQTEAKVEKADRKKTYMNWQATTQIEENRSVYERVLSQVPMAGAAYKRWWWDPELKRPRTEAVFLDDVFTPYGHSDFYTAPRVTYRQMILREEYEKRIRTGLYRDLSLGESSIHTSMVDESATKRASDKVEGVDPDASSQNEDGLRLIYQIDVVLDIEDDSFAVGPAPYILHIDQESASVLGLYRNWKKEDDRYRKKHHMTEWGFIPWRDGPPLGFTHVIGSLSVAGTGALRALLDSAHINNFPGGLKLNGGKTAGQNIQVNATELVEIAAPEGVMDPDIRKLIMPFPFNGPSTVLFTLLEWLTQQAESVVATASEKIADGGTDMPVGTAMALIEHGSANFRAIHARLHESMKRDLEIQHRLDAEFMEDKETVEELGELVVYRSDFIGPMDIVPVSDPNIFSEAQRYAQMQAMLQLKGDPQFAGFFKPDQLLGRILRLMNVPDIEGITSLPKEAKKLGALDENYVCSMNERPLKVYEGQDDLLHLKMHVMYATSPMFGANPLIAAGMLPQMLQHCKEHLLALYKKHTKAAVDATKVVTSKMGISNAEEGDEQSEEDDMIIMQAVTIAEQELAQKLSQIVMPGLQKMQEAMQQIAAANAPKPNPDIKAQIDGQIQVEQIRAKAKADQTAATNQTKAQQDQFNMAIQRMTDASTERLGKLASAMELIKQQQDLGGKMMLQEASSQQAQQLAVLTASLNALMAQLAPAKPAPGAPGEEDAAPAEGEEQPTAPTEGAFDLTGSPLVMGIQQVVAREIQEMLAQQQDRNAPQMQENLMAMLEQEHSTNQQAFSQLAAGLAQLAQERHSEIFVGEDGKKRARSFYPQQQQPAQE